MLLSLSSLSLLLLRPCCSWRRHEARARERVPASCLGRGASGRRRRRRRRKRRESSPLRTRERDKQSEKNDENSAAVPALSLCLHFPFSLSTPYSNSPRHGTQLFCFSLIPPEMAATLAVLFPAAVPAAALPRRSSSSQQQQRRRSGGSSSGTLVSCPRSSRCCSSIDVRQRRSFSSSLRPSSSVSSTAVRAAPADGPVVCLGEGLFGKQREIPEGEREEREETREHSISIGKKPRS